MKKLFFILFLIVLVSIVLCILIGGLLSNVLGFGFQPGAALCGAGAIVFWVSRIEVNR
jgi:hypothetical protein